LENSELFKTRILCIEEIAGSCEYFTYLMPNYEIHFITPVKDNLCSIKIKNYDLYFLDFTYIENRGIEFCRFVNQTVPDKPIIYSSANWEKEITKLILDSGASIHLEKPYSSEDLINIIENLLNKKSVE